MKWIVLGLAGALISTALSAQKTVFIPDEFTSDPYLKNWSWDRSYQSDNFVLFWGNVVGTDPSVYPNADLQFTPKAVCDTLETSYVKYVTEIGFCSDDASKNLGKYKIIIVMNDTWGTGGPSGWAFGGAYGNTIGAMWVHPNSTRDGGVLSHEFAHSLQAMISIQENPGGGFAGYEPAGFFWECHANFMRTQVYPRFASDDMPRWMATSMFHWSSTRHHYSSFRLLLHIQSIDGIEGVNDLWKKSMSNEHPLMAYRRLKGFDQAQLNDFIYDYATREVTFDYPVNNAGSIIRKQYDQFVTLEPHYLWRRFTILRALDEESHRYVTTDASAPQDYGYSIIPLYPEDNTKAIALTFKGHTEVNNTAGWRYGFVAVKADGTSVRYGEMYAADESEISFTLEADETAVYFVVAGAPTVHTTYVWEPGWPKIKRYPYEVTLQNAVPEGYQENFRSAYKTAGHVHPNGGGWVANTASVASTAFVGPKAIVLGTSVITGTARIDGTAWVENAVVGDAVVIDGNANVWEGSYTGTARITGNAILNFCTVSGSALVKDNAMEWGVTLGGTVVAGGDAEIGNCSAGVYLQTPHPNNNRDECDGKLAADASNKDVNSPMTGIITGAEREEAKGSLGLIIYPNPAKKSTTIELNDFRREEDVTLYIYDVRGKAVYNRKVFKQRVIEIKTTDTGKGPFIVKAVGRSRTVTGKLVLE